MADFLADATRLLQWVFQNIPLVVTTITANPLLFVGFLIMLVGLVVGIFKRLTNVV